MDELLTPLGRLHAVLEAYEEACSGASTIEQAWAKALGVPKDAVALEVAILAAELIPTCRQQVEESDNAFVRRSWADYGGRWCAPLLHQGVAMDQVPAHLPVSDLTTLSLIWTGQRDAGANEGNEPSESLIDSWLTQLREVRRQVDTDKTVAHHVRRMVLKRLDRLIDALDNFTRVGPSGVQQAATSVIGQMSIHRELINEAGGRALAAVVVSAVAGVYGFLADYTDAREGVIALARDLQWGMDIIEGSLADHEPGQLPSASGVDQPTGLPARFEEGEAPEEDDSPAA